MKRLTAFLQRALIDLERWCCTSTSQDLKTVLARIEHEGESFLMITLPAFGKDFERSLSLGQVAPGLFAGFRRRGGLPVFLGGFLEQVFDRRTGALLEHPSHTAIWALRQFTLMFAKIDLPISDERRDRAVAAYVRTDEEIRESESCVRQPSKRILAYRRLGTLLWSDSFDRVTADILAVPSRIIPKHGPGATADRHSGNEKWQQVEWTQRLDEMFPFGEHLIANWRSFIDLPDVQLLAPGAERPVRVITVPKTFVTPRIIAIEPVCMQYMQQGLLAAIERGLQQDRLCWELVGWRSQMPNQHLASKGSRDGSLSTLDLSEASDRVTKQHVRDLLRFHPSLWEAVDACRSRNAAVPGYGVIPIAKFASMGSALCFPFESMVFLTSILVGIEEVRGAPLSRKDIQSLVGQVRVYGDDIVVPTDTVHAVMDVLHEFGFVVNARKSFWTGKFRESCGKEFYDGSDVSIVRVRSGFPSSLRDGPEVISTISTRNQLYDAGMWECARYLDVVLERALGCPLPRVSGDSPVMGRHSFLGPDLSGKLHKKSHRPLVVGPVASVVIPVNPVDGYAALLKCLTQLEFQQSSHSVETPGYHAWYPQVENIWDLRSPNVKHLRRSGRPRSVNIKIACGPSA